MLHFFLKDKINPSQHGHRPGRGSVTCWREILSHVSEYKYIYEFDYKKFHDLIGRKFLLQALLNFKFPKSVAIDLIHLCSPYVRGTDPEDPLRLEMIPGFDIFHYYRGVIQGSNIAAYLGLLSLEDLGVYNLEKGKYIGYADDGLLFSNDPDVVDEWKSKLGGVSGVEPKPEKCGWVKYDGKWLKDLKFVGLALVEDGTKLRGATRSGRTGEMVWENKVSGEIWNFLKTLDGSLEGDKTSRATPVKPSAWDNRGYADLGFLSAMVFSDNLFNKNRKMANASPGIKGSFLDWITPEVVLHRRVDLESSLCFSVLRDYLRDPELSLRLPLASHGHQKANFWFQCDLGGWMSISRKDVNVRPNLAMTSTEEFKILHDKINDPRTPLVKGHTPSNPVGFDLFPSDNVRPTPYVVRGKKIHPVPEGTSLKLIEFAIRTQGKYTGDYVKRIPLVGRMGNTGRFAFPGLTGGQGPIFRR